MTTGAGRPASAGLARMARVAARPSSKDKLVVVFDEFQDVGGLPDAGGLLAVLRMSAHQLVGQDGVPPYAAVHQAGELCRGLKGGARAVGFVNGMLQSVRREIVGDEGDDPATVEGRLEAGDVTVGTGKRRQEGIDVGLSAQSGRQQDRGTYTILVRSGTTAFISSGYDVPYPERWARLAGGATFDAANGNPDRKSAG